MLITMEILNQSYSEIEPGWDCVWVAFKSRKEPEPAEDKVLQFLDWKLNGVISRYLLEEGYRRKETIFVPILRSRLVPYLALDGAKHFDPDIFLRSCDGLKLKNVLLYVEDPQQLDTIATELHRSPRHVFPERVTLGSPPK